MFGVIVMIAGVLMAAWMGFGRIFFSVGGEFVLAYSLTASVAIAALNIATGFKIRAAKKIGHRIHPQTVVALIVAWVGGIGFGFTVADANEAGLNTVMALLGGELVYGLSIGLGNLFGIMALGGSIAALIFARLDVRGPKPEEVPDDVDFVRPLPPPLP